ncbi:MAG: hypothetical protein JST51_07785 [Armatimonadetes bacterium]|nr:hypothetical protein [Armatimonadota bacterium]
MASPLNRIVAVPNWSFCDGELAEQAQRLLSDRGLTVHYCQGDADHHRTVIAFSGDQPDVLSAATELGRLILPHIDLHVRSGVHPRVGALDVMPFVLLDGDESILITDCRGWAQAFSDEFEVPVHLYEKAALPGREHRLPYLRGQVAGPPIELNRPVHPKWGVSVVGVRDFLLAANIDVATTELGLVRRAAKRIRDERDAGVDALRGVRALGFELRSRGMTQLSLNLTEPDQTSFDEVYAYCLAALDDFGATIVGTELIGVIRERDLPGAKRLQIDPRQVVRESATIR